MNFFFKIFFKDFIDIKDTNEINGVIELYRILQNNNFKFLIKYYILEDIRFA